MMSGLVDGVETSLSKMFEAVGARKAEIIDDAGLEEFEQNTCPGCGSCSGMYTANSMNCLCEAIGIGLPGNGTIPAVHSGRIMLAKHAGMAIMNLVEKDIKAETSSTKNPSEMPLLVIWLWAVLQTAYCTSSPSLMKLAWN